MKSIYYSLLLNRLAICPLDEKVTISKGNNGHLIGNINVHLPINKGGKLSPCEGNKVTICVVISIS